MKNYILLLFSAMLFSSQYSLAQSSNKDILYVGTFSERDSKGIYVVEFDRSNGTLKQLHTYEDKASPSFLAIHPNGKNLYAVYREGLSPKDKNGSVVSFEIGKQHELIKLNEQSAEGAGPCHISVDPEGRSVYVSNYVGGNYALYPILQDGSLGEVAEVIAHKGSSVHPSRQQVPHLHSVIPSPNGKYIYASDLGTDDIAISKVQKEGSGLEIAGMAHTDVAPGAGPRHFVFHPKGKYAYSIEELTSTITLYEVNKRNGGLTAVQTISTLPEGQEVGDNTTADIHISPDGMFVYGSNRGHDSIAIFAVNKKDGTLSLIGHESSGGVRPRNFCIDKAGKFVFVANRESDNVVVFSRDEKTGKLTPTGQEINIPAAVCIQQL